MKIDTTGVVVVLATSVAWVFGTPMQPGAQSLPTKLQADTVATLYKQALGQCGSQGASCEASARRVFVETMNCVVHGQRAADAASLDDDFGAYADLVAGVVTTGGPTGGDLGPCFAGLKVVTVAPSARPADGPTLEALQKFREQAEELHRQSTTNPVSPVPVEELSPQDKLRQDVEAVRQRMLGSRVGSQSLTPPALLPGAVPPTGGASAEAAAAVTPSPAGGPLPGSSGAALPGPSLGTAPSAPGGAPGSAPTIPPRPTSTLTVSPTAPPPTLTVSPSPVVLNNSAFAQAYNACCTRNFLGCASASVASACRARAQQSSLTRVLTPQAQPSSPPTMAAGSPGPATPASAGAAPPSTYTFGAGLTLPCSMPPHPQNALGYASYLANCKRP